MGDRTYTDIKFSGRVTSEQAQELLDALNAQHCASNDTEHGELTLKDLRDPHHLFYDDQCNYADMDSVETFCKEHGIPYCKTWQAGGDYGPGMQVFTGTELHDCATIEDEPAVTKSEFLKLGTGILEFFDRFDFSASKYPPLVIDESYPPLEDDVDEAA